MNSFERGLRNLAGVKSPVNAVTVDGVSVATVPCGSYGADNAMKLSAVSRCVDVLSDSIGKLPVFIFDTKDKKRVDDHWLLPLLNVRPNPVQSPSTFKKMLEANRLLHGNAVAYILRNPYSLRPEKLIPLQAETVTRTVDRKTGTLFYNFTDPVTQKGYSKIPMTDMIDIPCYTKDGYTGISVLRRAAEVVGTGKAAQEYLLSYYQNGGQPSGILSTDTDLNGYVEQTGSDGQPVRKSKKDIIREEWMKRHGGSNNGQQVAVLDQGLKYTPIAVSNRDAQFVEQNQFSVEDIGRFFGVPLYKLQAGKQSYSSNEQNAVEYVTGTLHPIIEAYQEELTYKLLPQADVEKGYEVRINLMAELKGDTASRGAWYKTMRETGVFSVNDIRALEDLEDVEGGDNRQASLNYVPLKDWEELSRRNHSGNMVSTG